MWEGAERERNKEVMRTRSEGWRSRNCLSTVVRTVGRGDTGEARSCFNRRISEREESTRQWIRRSVHINGYPITAQDSGFFCLYFLRGSTSMGRYEVISVQQLPWLHSSLVSSLMSILPSRMQTFTQAALFLVDTHTQAIYLEVGCLCLVHSESHENSKLEVVGERLSVREERNSN